MAPAVPPGEVTLPPCSHTLAAFPWSLLTWWMGSEGGMGVCVVTGLW